MPHLTAALLFHNLLDCDAIASLLDAADDFRVVGTTTDLDAFASLCATTPPDLSIFEASFPASRGDIFSQAEKLAGEERLRFSLFVDDLPNQTRARRAITIGQSGYVLRKRSASQLLAAIQEVVAGAIPLDGFTSDWLETGRSARNEFTASPLLAKLSPRQLEIMQLVAAGHTITECAQLTSLASCTIENHRAQIMKKLGLHKAVHLSLMAVREGLIIP
jgi:DNA-binding NarL/FixJ family response regulator